MYQQSEAEWEDGFRQDRRPWHQIAYWEMLADGMEEFTAHLTGMDEVTLRKRRRVFYMLFTVPDRFTSHEVRLLGEGRAKATRTQRRTAPRVTEILRWVLAEGRARRILARAEALRRLIQPDGPVGPDRLPIDALFNEDGTGINLTADFDPCDLLAAADVIIGVDVTSGREFTVFDSTALESSSQAADGHVPRILRVEMDADTDDLDRLKAVVGAVKGIDD